MKAFIILSVCMIACILQFAEADEHNDECKKKKDEMRAIAEEMRKEGKMPECMKKHGMGESKKPWNEMSEEERAEKREKWKNMSEEERDEIKHEKLEKLKNNENKVAIMVCLRETCEKINKKLKNPLSDEGFEKAMENCPFQNA